MRYIKIGFRNNLFYLLMLIIFNFLRKIDSIIMDKIIGLSGTLLLTFLMFLGEFIAGLSIFIYQISFFPKRKKSTFLGIKLIQAKSDISHRDSIFKIYFLIFITSYFDFIEFMVATFYIPQYEDIPKSLIMRFGSILTISAAILCYYLLRLPIFKHHIFSLLIIFICFIIITISKNIFQLFYSIQNILHISLIIGLVFINHFFTAFKDVIEKYLLEFDFINPFKMLMIEGIIGCIITSIYSYKEEPFENIKEIYKKNDYKFILLIVCLFLFFFLSGGRNAYRVITNKIYSPMTRTLTDSILDPLLIIYYYCVESDFKIGDSNKQNILYFIINLIISIIIDFCSCIYNELLILYFCNLEHNTHHFVSLRARSMENYENFNIEFPEEMNEKLEKDSSGSSENDDNSNSEEEEEVEDRVPKVDNEGNIK